MKYSPKIKKRNEESSLDNKNGLSERNAALENSSNSSFKGMALIVEDDELCQLAIIKQLKCINFNYCVCDTKDKALEACRKFYNNGIQINAIFVDYFLKDNSLGSDFLKEMNIHHWNSNSFVIAASSNDDIEIKQKFTELNANYTIKPITKTAFVSIKEEILKKMKENKEICPFDNYYLDRKLNESSQVYLVGKTGTSEKYLMKIVNIQKDKESSVLSKELKPLQDLSYPVIVKLVESSIVNNSIYIFMEYPDGGTLFSKIKEKRETNGKFTFNEIFDWVIELLLGLYILHNKGIIHKDINIQNILLSSKNIAKIPAYPIGFEIRKEQPKSKMSCLTAPELETGKDYTFKSDIFYVGLVICELLFPLDIVNEDGKIENLQKNIKENNEIDWRLKRLIKLTVSKEDKRATAKDILSLNFVHKRAEELIETILNDEDNRLLNEFKEILAVPDNFVFNFEEK